MSQSEAICRTSALHNPVTMTIGRVSPLVARMCSISWRPVIPGMSMSVTMASYSDTMFNAAKPFAATVTEKPATERPVEYRSRISRLSSTTKTFIDAT